jgi:hypothetical protein
LARILQTTRRSEIRAISTSAQAWTSRSHTTSGFQLRLTLVRQEGQGNRGSYEPSRAIGHALDRFIGTWSAEQEAEVLKAIEIFEQVDESFWQ